MAAERTGNGALKRIVLDTNILLRAVFGERVLPLLKRYEESTVFHSPDVCFEDANRYLPKLAAKGGFDPAICFAVLFQVSHLVQGVDRSLYEEHEASAMSRIAHRDASDWPIVATALLLDCPVWTEDQDFFGCGVATWNTRTVEVYLRNPA